MAAAFGMRYNPHVRGAGIGLAASLQLMAVLPTHTPTALAPLGLVFEFDRTEHPIRQAILRVPIEHARGVIPIPDGPGLGVEIDRSALECFKACGPGLAQLSPFSVRARACRGSTAAVAVARQLWHCGGVDQVRLAGIIAGEAHLG
jgi:hypothetical protein